MAIRINRNKLKLSTLQVQEARLRYYHKCEPARQLAWEYEVSESIMKDAIYGKRGYAAIPDPENLSPEAKDPKTRADWKSMQSNNRSYQRRNKRIENKMWLDMVKEGLPIEKTPLVSAYGKSSPSNIDWKAEERKAKVAQNRHYKGWDE
jgi:hypothetical protein